MTNFKNLAFWFHKHAQIVAVQSSLLVLSQLTCAFLYDLGKGQFLFALVKYEWQVSLNCHQGVHRSHVSHIVI